MDRGSQLRKLKGKASKNQTRTTEQQERLQDSKVASPFTLVQDSFGTDKLLPGDLCQLQAAG